MLVFLFSFASFLVAICAGWLLGELIFKPEKGVVQEEHYGEEVWVSRLGESLRKKNCLCLQCAKMKPAPDNCPYAQAFYENCQKGNIALMVTRCRDWQPKEK